ncbi:IS3 family transposase, partial [Arthrospira platensis SPKY2]
MSEGYRVSTLCRIMKVTRSRFYSWKAAQQQTVTDPDAKILQIITTLRQNRRYLCYGSRRLRAFVVNQGIAVSRKRIRKIMKKYGLKVNYKRSFRPSTTDSRHNLPVADNLLG